MTKKLLFLLSIISTLFQLAAQTQIGSDIDGLFANERFGEGLSISADGNIIAANGFGASSADTPRVYKLVNDQWTLLGTDSSGGNFDGVGAFSVDLSADGHTIAIGSLGIVRVYEFDINTSIWSQKGADLLNTTNVGSFGYSVSLSDDGNILVVGIPGFGTPPPPEEGITQVFRFTSGSWSQIGSDIIGPIPNAHSGLSVRSSANANRLAIANYDSVFVYEFDNNDWTQVGNEIVGDGVGGLNIREVAFSEDGNTVVLSEPDYSDTLIQRGRVRVYNYENNSWNQTGNTIFGELAGYRTGWSVSLALNGNLLALGEIGTTTNSTDTGRVRLFENQNGIWTQLGIGIFGEASEDYTGWRVRLAPDGSTLAVSSTHNDGNGTSAGHVRMYNIESLLSIASPTLEDVIVYPNPANKLVMLSAANNIQSIEILSTTGQRLLKTTETYVDVSILADGLYYVLIKGNNNRVTTKKLIKKK